MLLLTLIKPSRCKSNSFCTDGGKERDDSRVETDVEYIPIQNLRNCGVDDKKLRFTIVYSVELDMGKQPLRSLVAGRRSLNLVSLLFAPLSELFEAAVDILNLSGYSDL